MSQSLAPTLTPEQCALVVEEVQHLLDTSQLPQLRDYSEVTAVLPQLASDVQEASAEARTTQRKISHCRMIGERLVALGAQLYALADTLEGELSEGEI